MILVSIPLKKEKKILLDRLRRLGLEFEVCRRDGQECAVDMGHRVAVATGGLGMVAFQTGSSFWLSQWPECELLVCAGTAGAITTDLELGDVVLGVESGFWDGSLESFAGDMRARRRIAAETYGFRVLEGLILSTDKDVLDGIQARELHSRTEAIAVAWEGIGGARAAQLRQCPFLEIRGITDFANDQALGDFGETMELAMTNVAESLYTLLDTPNMP